MPHSQDGATTMTELLDIAKIASATSLIIASCAYHAASPYYSITPLAVGLLILADVLLSPLAAYFRKT